MKLTAPTQPAWVIAMILGVLGILGAFVSIPAVSEYHFWLLAVAFVLLAAATALKGL